MGTTEARNLDSYVLGLTTERVEDAGSENIAVNVLFGAEKLQFLLGKED